MTIYAIVNSLIGTGDSSLSADPIWTVVSASAILQGGNPYFVPDFAERFEARPALALRIGKLGKGIAKRFAYRYVDTLAPATVMLATDLLDSLRSKGLPWTQALSYDRSIAIGSYAKIPFEEISDCLYGIEIFENGEERQYKWEKKSLTHSIEDIIFSLSRDNALKTGDIILAGVGNYGPTLHPGQRIVLNMNGTDSLKFNIR